MCVVAIFNWLKCSRENGIGVVRVQIFGIDAYYGDASGAIIRDGRLIAAIEEERFNRKKPCAAFLAAAVRYCLEAAS
jgi:predicted NodU family carbamoyl transferase